MSKTIQALVCIATGIIIFTVSCSKKSEDLLTTPDPTGCDTVNMNYTADVTPILQANCYSCHGNGAFEGGINLDTYNSVKNLADDGGLLGVITHASGYPLMPEGGAKLSDCDINKIRDWINRGAINN